MSNNNLSFWELFREVPTSAQKPISGGRLNGMTDINPVWRIKKLTEVFGICGLGWKYEITDTFFRDGSNGEVAVFVGVNLYYKGGDDWSAPIPGTGGSMFIAKERTGLHTSDEAVKMALTDAISVACKALGIGADVYWSADRSKYDKQKTEQKTANKSEPTLTADQLNEFGDLVKNDIDPAKAKDRLKELVTSLGYQKLSEVKQSEYEKLKNAFIEYGLPFSFGEDL